MPLRFLTAGESHGPALAGILEGLPAGLQLAPAFIQAELARRKLGLGRSRRQGLETDRVEVLGGLRREEYDVALLPVIDYQRMPGLRMLTCGGIGSDGPTLTVRLFSAEYFQLIHDNTVAENQVLASQRADEELIVRLRGQVYRIRY